MITQGSDIMSHFDNFLKIKFNQMSSEFDTEKSVLYEDYYSMFDNNYLRKIFALIHSNLNDLFSFMNSKNNTYGGHYNAAESRELIELIDQVRVLEAKLNGEISFEIDAYYKEIIISCSKFLFQIVGSVLQEGFQIINKFVIKI